jgi:hypothetical protein
MRSGETEHWLVREFSGRAFFSHALQPGFSSLTIAKSQKANTLLTDSDQKKEKGLLPFTLLLPLDEDNMVSERRLDWLGGHSANRQGEGHLGESPVELPAQLPS